MEASGEAVPVAKSKNIFFPLSGPAMSTSYRQITCLAAVAAEATGLPMASVT